MEKDKTEQILSKNVENKRIKKGKTRTVKNTTINANKNPQELQL